MRAWLGGLVIAMAAALLGPAVPARAAGELTVTLVASAAQTPYGEDVTFTVSVTAGGAPVPGADVELGRSGADGAQSVVGFSSTDGSGTAVLLDDPLVRSTYVATASAEGGEPDYLPLRGTSAPVEVAVSFVVAAEVSPVAVPPGGQLTLTAGTEPAAAGSALVEERLGTGEWQSLGEHPVAADGIVTVELGRRSAVGTHAFRVTRLADTLHVAGFAETTASVTVTGPGKARSWRPIGGTKTRPFHWRTCRIGYRLNTARMPPHGRADLAEAIRRLTQVSGIRLRYLGTTTRVPYAGDSRAGLNRITIAWATPRETRGLLAPGIGGVGGTTFTSTGRILTGYLVMNTQFTKAAEAGFGAGSPHGMVLMHELGHVVGLDHAPSTSQVMFASASLPSAIWGAGDRRGLARLGRVGGCR